MERSTYFYDETGKKIADEPVILSVTLFKGMVVTIHGYEGDGFEVEDWNYHLGHTDEDAGLRINLRRRT